VRRNGIPIGFWMQQADGIEYVRIDELSRLISANVGEKIIGELIRQEMTPRSVTVPLPLVTIAICTKDRPAGLERLLASLRDQESTLPCGSAGIEILVVDNAPSDERTRELAGANPQVRYVREVRPGLNFARNRALKEARGEILAFLDDDVIVDQHWSAGLVSAWSENRDAAAFTGQVLPMELDTEAQVVFERRGGFRHKFDRIRFGPVMSGNELYPGGAGIFGAGANMAFRVDMLREVGGFDEALDTGAAIPGGGDLDIFYRVIRAGYTLVYEPRFLVFHQHRRDMRALRHQYRRSWGLGFMCYVFKCIKHDPGERPKLVRLISWWYADHAYSLLRNFKKKVTGKLHVPPSIFLGEVWGGTVGMFGGYARSIRRSAAIRKRFP
jgi:glycosyltransferase involved in cell wall biosynthesis